MTTVSFPVLPVDYDDEAANQFAESLNYIAETTAKTHAMVLEMHEVFAALKPMMGGMPLLPAMPPGIGLPGMPKF